MNLDIFRGALKRLITKCQAGKRLDKLWKMIAGQGKEFTDNKCGSQKLKPAI